MFSIAFPIFGVIFNMTKLFKDLRISFIVLNRERYENLFLPEIENDDPFFIGNTVKDMIRSLAAADGEYEHFQNYYFNSQNYSSWVAMKRRYVRDILNRLNNDRVVHSDDLESFRQYFLFYSASEYFRASWYCLPTLEFSNEFYKNVVPRYFQCLLNHESGPARYQYQLEQISLNDPTARLAESNEKQRYYLVNETLIDDLLIEMQNVKDDVLAEAVNYEYQLMVDALRKAKRAEAYIVLTSF